MKKLILLSLLAFTISCSSQDEDPEPMRDTAARTTDVTTGTGCAVVQNINAHSQGVTVTVKAELLGHYEKVSMIVEKRGEGRSWMRKPSDKDVTVMSAAFGRPGDTLHLGLFPCSDSKETGKIYKLTITQGDIVTVKDWKVGNTFEYIVK